MVKILKCFVSFAYTKPSKRFWEIDFLRGLAIIMMITFHIFFDLNYFGLYRLGAEIYSGFWWLFARATATIFIFLVGVSLTLSYARAKKMKKYRTKKALFMKYLARGARIFSWGLLITLMTWLFLRDGFIVFGILHFIGLGIILAWPFLRHGTKSTAKNFHLLLPAAIFIAAGLYLKNFTFDFSWLTWLGLAPAGFYTLDYFPLLPWFGVILAGLFFGNIFYPKGKRKFVLFDIKNRFTRLFCFLGRHSLFIYLIHQPILIALLYLLTWLSGQPLLF